MLRSKRITLDFTETPLEDVLQFMSQVLQINIVIGQAARKKLAETGGLVTMQVKELRIDQALELLASNRLAYKIIHGVLYVTSKESLEAIDRQYSARLRAVGRSRTAPSKCDGFLGFRAAR